MQDIDGLKAYTVGWMQMINEVAHEVVYVIETHLLDMRSLVTVLNSKE